MAFVLVNFKSTNIENINLILYNNDYAEISKFPISKDSFFSIEFIHSVNKSPVIEYYKFDEAFNIYNDKTIYYNFGAGVSTDIENDEKFTLRDDGSMLIENINNKITDLSYYLSSIYDHILKIDDGDPISLWEICGKNKIIHIKIGV